MRTPPNRASIKWIIRIALLTGVPGLATTFTALYLGEQTGFVWFSMLFLNLFFWLVIVITLVDHIRRPWQALSNILAGFGEKDYSMRGYSNDPDDPIGLTLQETGRLAVRLQEERRIRLEQHKLLAKLLEETDVAVFCFNQFQRLVLVNPYGARLFGRSVEDLLDQTVTSLGLSFAFEAAYATGHQHKFPQRTSRWLVKQGSYREDGQPHRFLLLADIQATLREEELGAWRKLIRVLGHELINSMTPMKTMAASMERMLSLEPLPDGWKGDFSEACRVIAERVDNMSRFVRNYSQIARQPQPEKTSVSLLQLVRRLTRLDPFQKVSVETATDLQLWVDRGQMEQVLINLLKNALEAMDGKEGKVQLCWSSGEANQHVIQVLDEGEGITNPDNLFVPYFTTKRGGNGIGLVVSRQIVEAHGGKLTLENREDHNGCIASVVLPASEAKIL